MNDTPQLLAKLKTFSEQSLFWCCQESEKAIITVSHIIDILVSKSNNIASLSKESITAMESAQILIGHLQDPNKRNAANQLGLALQASAKQDKEINALVTPIIETLQFQDRINQNMQNLNKMFAVWLEFRARIQEGDPWTKDMEKTFGERLLKHTTMEEERSFIKRRITSVNVAEPEQKQGDIMFF